MTQPRSEIEYANPHERPKTSGLAITGLVLGICSIVLGCFLPVVLAVPAIICSAIALSQTGKNPRLQGRGLAIGGLVTGIASLVLILPLMLAILLPSLNRARETAQRVHCASNMRQIGLASMLYANDQRDGSLPPDAEMMLATQDITADVFTCPGTDHAPDNDPTLLTHGQDLSYVWVGGGLDNTAGFDVPVAFEPLSNHDGDGGNVLFADGSVTFNTPASIETMLDDLLADGRVTQAEYDTVLDVPVR